MTRLFSSIQYFNSWMHMASETEVQSDPGNTCVITIYCFRDYELSPNIVLTTVCFEKKNFTCVVAQIWWSTYFSCEDFTDELSITIQILWKYLFSFKFYWNGHYQILQIIRHICCCGTWKYAIWWPWMTFPTNLNDNNLDLVRWIQYFAFCFKAMLMHLTADISVL